MKTIVNLLINGVAVFIAGRLLPGVIINDFGTAVVVAVVLALVNTFIKPVVVLLTLPVNILTLGLFTLVINALMILLVDTLVPGFAVKNFLWALIFSVVLTIVGTVIYSFTS